MYQLLPEEMHPLYEINIPNQLPMRKIEEKMGHWEVSVSTYAYGLGDVYQTGSVLHFTFSKDGYLVRTFYGLDTDRLLFCGTELLSEPVKNLPFIGLIHGVYKTNFFSLVHPETIAYFRTRHPEFFPKDLLQMDDEDNGVIAFYSFDRDTVPQLSTLNSLQTSFLPDSKDKQPQ